MSDPSLLVLQPGAWFHERYRVVRCLAAGGMGAVHEVLDTKTDSPRALKVILPNLVGDEEARSRFALEARVTGSIQSDHLVRITDAGLDAATGMPFLVMDLLEGRDLSALVEAEGPLPAADVVLYLAQAALALDKTHAAGIVHRDLKPENLFVTRRDDGSPCVKILDFGIAKVIADSAGARQTRPMGTPLYMAPEQVEGAGPIGPGADIYSLGQIAFTLLVGEAFWTADAEGTIFALLSKIMLGSAESASERARRRRGVELPPAFDAWFRRITAADPAGRFERATLAVAALAAALGIALDGQHALASGASVPSPRLLPTLRSPGTPTPVSHAFPSEDMPTSPWPLRSGPRPVPTSGLARAAVAGAVLAGVATLAAIEPWRRAPPHALVDAVAPATAGPPIAQQRLDDSGAAFGRDLQVSSGSSASAAGAASLAPRPDPPRPRARATAGPPTAQPLKDEGIY